MGIVAKADDVVTKSTSQVFETLGRVKFLLVTIPIVCVIAGIVAQRVIPERNVATATWKMGSFATPDRPTPDALAGERQMRSRMRARAIELKQAYPGSLLITTTVTDDVTVMAATAKGPEETKLFLREIIQTELDFENGRLEKLQAVQLNRKNSLESTRSELSQRVDDLEKSQQGSATPIGMLAVQQEIDNARSRIATIGKELDTMAVLNASDLYIDTSQFIQEPIVVASSNWYRPILYGAGGLGVGLVLVIIIFFISMIRSFSSKRNEKQKEKAKEDELEQPGTSEEET
jgi:hypothetical protein